MYQNCLIQFSVAEQKILRLRIYAKKIKKYIYISDFHFSLQILSAKNQIIHIL